MKNHNLDRVAKPTPTQKIVLKELYNKLAKEFGITYHEQSGTIYLRWHDSPKDIDNLVEVKLTIDEVTTDTTPHTACDSCNQLYDEKALTPIEIQHIYPKDEKYPVKYTKIKMMCYDCWCPQ